MSQLNYIFVLHLSHIFHHNHIVLFFLHFQGLSKEVELFNQARKDQDKTKKERFGLGAFKLELLYL